MFLNDAGLIYFGTIWYLVPRLPVNFVSIPRVRLSAVISVVIMPSSTSPLEFLPAWCFPWTMSWESEIVMNWMWKQHQWQWTRLPAGLWHNYSMLQKSLSFLLRGGTPYLQCSLELSSRSHWLGNLEHSSLKSLQVSVSSAKWGKSKHLPPIEYHTTWKGLKWALVPGMHWTGAVKMELGWVEVRIMLKLLRKCSHNQRTSQKKKSLLNIFLSWNSQTALKWAENTTVNSSLSFPLGDVGRVPPFLPKLLIEYLPSTGACLRELRVEEDGQTEPSSDNPGKCDRREVLCLGTAEAWDLTVSRSARDIFSKTGTVSWYWVGWHSRRYSQGKVEEETLGMGPVWYWSRNEYGKNHGGRRLRCEDDCEEVHGSGITQGMQPCRDLAFYSKILRKLW